MRLWFECTLFALSFEKKSYLSKIFLYFIYFQSFFIARNVFLSVATYQRKYEFKIWFTASAYSIGIFIVLHFKRIKMHYWSLYMYLLLKQRFSLTVADFGYLILAFGYLSRLLGFPFYFTMYGRDEGYPKNASRKLN